MPRPSVRARRWWSGGLIAALLFLQLATAAHACPRLSAATTMAGMPCADTMAGGPMGDEAQTGLCAEHCRAGAMNVDPGQAPDVPPPTCTPVLAVSCEPAARTLAAPWTAHARLRNRAPPPTHAALHCCYRT